MGPKKAIIPPEHTNWLDYLKGVRFKEYQSRDIIKRAIREGYHAIKIPAADMPLAILAEPLHRAFTYVVPEVTIPSLANYASRYIDVVIIALKAGQRNRTLLIKLI